MKKNFTIVSITCFSLLTIIQSENNQAISNGQGAPAGRTGSPFDGQTCAASNCHVGTASVSPSQIISSNIPASGYVPGQTYTITASPAQSGINKYGFQISPMNASGALLGTIIVTNPSATKIVGTKYITHTSSGTSGTGGRTWTFDWVAPAAGTGSVTFYGAFNFANGNNQSNGDIIRTNTLTVNESTTSGISSIENDPFGALLYPNPLTSEARIRVNLTDHQPLILQYADISGKILSERFVYPGNPGVQEYTINVPAELKTGIYRLLISSGNKLSVKTFLKK